MDLIIAAAFVAAGYFWSRAEEPEDEEELPEYVPWEDEQPDDYDEEND